MTGNVGRRPAFSAREFLTRVAAGRTVHKYRIGEVVYSQGDPSDAIFYVQTGKVTVTVVSEHGKEAVVAIVGPDEFFGFECLVKQNRRTATATASMESVITRLEKAAAVAVIHEQTAFSEMLIGHIVDRTIRAEADLTDQLFNSSERRLARLLLLMANFGKEGAPEPLLAKISQQTLADTIGTTRSRVSFFMNKFRKLGYVNYNGRIEVHKSLLNVVLHE